MHHYIDYKDFERGNFSMPAHWIYCFNDNCKFRDTCLRRNTAHKLGKTLTWGKAVFPAACEDGECDFFVEMKTTVVAWGLKKALDGVRFGDMKALRHDIIKTMGSRRDFVRYNSGEWKLSERQQRKISDAFGRYGYGDIEFDNYCEVVSLTGE